MYIQLPNPDYPKALESLSRISELLKPDFRYDDDPTWYGLIRMYMERMARAKYKDMPDIRERNYFLEQWWTRFRNELRSYGFETCSVDEAFGISESANGKGVRANSERKESERTNSEGSGSRAEGRNRNWKDVVGLL